MIAVYPLLYQVSANRQDNLVIHFTAMQCYRVKSNICSLNKGFANSLLR